MPHDDAGTDLWQRMFDDHVGNDAKRWNPKNCEACALLDAFTPPSLRPANGPEVAPHPEENCVDSECPLHPSDPCRDGHKFPVGSSVCSRCSYVLTVQCSTPEPPTPCGKQYIHDPHDDCDGSKVRATTQRTASRSIDPTKATRQATQNHSRSVT